MPTEDDPRPREPLRILHINKFLYRRGGAEGYMLDLADKQREQGHDVRLFGMSHPDNDLTWALSPLPSYVEFEPPPRGAADRARLFSRMLWSRETARALTSALEQWRPQVIHCHNIYHQLSPAPLAVAARLGIPVVLTMHDYKLVCPTYRFLDKGELCTACVTKGPWQAAKRSCSGSRAASTAAAAEVWIHRKTDAYGPVHRFVAPSQFLADQMLRAGVFTDRIRVIDNFTEVDGVKAQDSSGSGLVFAGRLSEEKGVEAVIRCWGTLLTEDRLPPTALLRIVGDGPDRVQLETLATQVAPGRVVFHGRVSKSEVSELIRSACASVAASNWYENQPLAVLESFAAGVPVICTDLGGLPEVVEHGKTGWIFNSGDDHALAGAMEEAVTKPEMSRKRGSAARLVAEHRFAPQEHVATIARLYEEVLGEATRL